MFFMKMLLDYYHCTSTSKLGKGMYHFNHIIKDECLKVMLTQDNLSLNGVHVMARSGTALCEDLGL